VKPCVFEADDAYRSAVAASAAMRGELKIPHGDQVAPWYVESLWYVESPPHHHDAPESPSPSPNQ